MEPDDELPGPIRRVRDWLDRATTRQVRRVVFIVVGFTVLLFGVAMIVLPGPAFVVIPLGLAILAAEITWARRWYARARLLADESVRLSRPWLRRSKLMVIRLNRRWRRRKTAPRPRAAEPAGRSR